MDSDSSSLYEDLEVLRNATHLEMKTSYQRLILLFHPDRNKTGGDRFIRIQHAWKILGTEVTRAEYDKKFSQETTYQSRLFSENVPMSEFQVDSEGILQKHCRCGEYYELALDDWNAGYTLVNCAGCSLYVNVIP